MLITSDLVRALERPFILVSLLRHRHSIGRVLSYADDTECSVVPSGYAYDDGHHLLGCCLQW